MNVGFVRCPFSIHSDELPVFALGPRYARGASIPFPAWPVLVVGNNWCLDALFHLLNVLPVLVCRYFGENFCIKTHQEGWPVVLFVSHLFLDVISMWFCSLHKKIFVRFLFLKNKLGSLVRYWNDRAWSVTLSSSSYWHSWRSLKYSGRCHRAQLRSQSTCHLL